MCPNSASRPLLPVLLPAAAQVAHTAQLSAVLSCPHIPVLAAFKTAEICASSAEACAQASAENAQISAVLTRAHMSQKPIQKKMMPKHLIQFHLTSK